MALAALSAVLFADAYEVTLKTKIVIPDKDETGVSSSLKAAARELSGKEHLVLVCGHYEGVDQRLIDSMIDREYSLGDFVMTSGNPAAIAMTDAIVRLLPGALGDDESSEDESFSEGLLEYPQYTRPPEFQGMAVPEVLLNGDHARIAAWRRREAERLTRERRPDLWKEYLNNQKLGGKNEHS